mmetsp:Transcript_21418/g.46528  ORF Transcript_21418/g.46528 Transcript_21418/m.46528 type:complete len:200 (-) Transcript_21418:1719-2318(-)
MLPGEACWAKTWDRTSKSSTTRPRRHPRHPPLRPQQLPPRPRALGRRLPQPPGPHPRRSWSRRGRQRWQNTQRGQPQKLLRRQVGQRPPSRESARRSHSRSAPQGAPPDEEATAAAAAAAAALQGGAAPHVAPRRRQQGLPPPGHCSGASRRCPSGRHQQMRQRLPLRGAVQAPAAAPGLALIRARRGRTPGQATAKVS